MSSLINDALAQRMYADEMAEVLERAAQFMEDVLLRLYETEEDAADSVDAAALDMLYDVLDWFRGGDYPAWMTVH